ncbi:MAG: DsbE family thiol:disulfide interchange protein [Rhizomicrobium sp.]|jgi:cytochrome c biogenesis protein CcmG/thiol:disulfide interchange protein DsbE
MMTRALYILPIVALAVLGYVFMRSLNSPPPDQLPSVLIDKPAPAVSLPPLDAQTKGFTSADLKSGHVTVVNLFASWCVPCHAEAPGLQEIARQQGVALYGIVYKDTPDKARAFLGDVGNPFARIDIDADGHAGIDWGITGVPETFVIDGKGIVRLRYAGPAIGDALNNIILPAIAQARASN